MIDTRLKLSVLHDDNGSFADRSNEAVDFSRDTFSMTLNADEDYLYVGFSKPFNAAYCEIATANQTANTLTMEYYNGSTWEDLVEGRDLTKGLTRSGYLTWDKPTDWASFAVDSKSKYWIRLRPSATHTSTVVSGLNLIFADDYDLQTEFPAVIATGFIPEGEISHIKSHVAARNQIIQDLRAKGFLKIDSNGNWQNITPWDLLDIEEVRQAAVCLALSKIYFNYSDNKDDHWMAKSKTYELRYATQLDNVKLTVDTNDDGLVNASERLTFKTSTMVR